MVKPGEKDQTHVLRRRIPRVACSIAEELSGELQDSAAFGAAVSTKTWPDWLAEVLSSPLRSLAIERAHTCWLARHGHLRRTRPQIVATTSRSGRRPRMSCPRCAVSIAVMPRDHQGRERIRWHNCPHRRACTDGRHGFAQCPECVAVRAAQISTPAMVARPSSGSIAIVMDRRAASALPAIRIATVRPAGGSLVSVSVPAYAVNELVTGQYLVKIKARRARVAEVHP